MLLTINNTSQVGCNKHSALRRMNNSITLAPNLLIMEYIFSSDLRLCREMKPKYSEGFMVQCTAFISPYVLTISFDDYD